MIRILLCITFLHRHSWRVVGIQFESQIVTMCCAVDCNVRALSRKGAEEFKQQL